MRRSTRAGQRQDTRTEGDTRDAGCGGSTALMSVPTGSPYCRKRSMHSNHARNGRSLRVQNIFMIIT